ncbi:hypothetical protein ACQW02_03235 [Humitalea sp. 24SJ18S-53]|uniref:hypothetical protein n=1 Tax=Humitalea sp. 24SJ18S-53 TaxID=3422307 RepID=UPI003D66A875
MAITLDDATAFRAAIGDHLGADTPADVASVLAAGVAMGEEAFRATPALPGQTALNLRIGRYVIRDDDLPVIETIGSAATGLATLAASAGIAWPAIVPAITAVATLAWTLWRKGALLTPRQLRVVGLLQTHGPCPVAVLAPLAAADGAGAVPETMLEGVLLSLKEVETRDGHVVALAAADTQGFWRARGV